MTSRRRGPALDPRANRCPHHRRRGRRARQPRAGYLVETPPRAARVQAQTRLPNARFLPPRAPSATEQPAAERLGYRGKRAADAAHAAANGRPAYAHLADRGHAPGHYTHHPRGAVGARVEHGGGGGRLWQELAGPGGESISLCGGGGAHDAATRVECWEVV